MMSPFQYLPYNMAYVRARVRACVCACTVEIELGMLCAAGFIDMYAFRHAYGLPYRFHNHQIVYCQLVIESQFVELLN